jgi:hydrogenase small subunit
MTTGLSCEGDSVAMTSATNPSLEDIITQAIPGMPKVVVHNQVIAYEVGQEYARPGSTPRRASSTRSCS